jgi:hypothetical protein
LTAESISASGCYTADQTKPLLRWPESWKERGSGLVFPYPGAEDGYCKIKLDDPRREGESDKSEGFRRDFHGAAYVREDEEPSGDLIKYETPMNARLRVYVPSHVPALLQQGEALWITEGEKKALLGCQAGLAMVAVPGVTCFGDPDARDFAKGQGQNRQILHPDLKALIEPKNEVVILFDSDVDENENVLRALAVAGKMLLEHGAEPCVAYLPPGSGKGLDDYFMGLPEQERNSEDPLFWVKESKRPLNVYEVLDWLDEHWSDFNEDEQRIELERAAKLAVHILPNPKRDLDRWIRTAAKKLDVTQKEVRALVPDRKREAKLKGYRALITSWIEQNGARYCYGSEQVRIGGRDYAYDGLLSKLVLDSNEILDNVSERLLRHALSEWLENQREAVHRGYREKIAFQSGNDSLVERFVLAVTGKSEPLDVAVIKHFIWQVKRKLFGLKVEHHLMPILLGKTGGGKTEAVKKLLSPIGDLCDPVGDLTILEDERHSFRLAQSFVLFFDEMGFAERSAVDLLKQKITAENLSWRILGHNKRTTVRNNATFIGATNRNLSDLIYDPTGMRRFYEMKCLDRLDWDEINAIDYVALWASVDPDGPCPIKPLLPELQTLQETYRARDSVEEFLEECCVLPKGGAEEAHWSPAKQLYLAYVDHQTLQRRAPWGLTKWGRRMRELVEEKVGGKDVGWKDSDGRKYSVRLNEESYTRMLITRPKYGRSD